MNYGNTSELVRQQHRAFDMNMSIDKARHEKGLGGINRFVMAKDLLNHTIRNSDCGRVDLTGMNID